MLNTLAPTLEQRRLTWGVREQVPPERMSLRGSGIIPRSPTGLHIQVLPKGRHILPTEIYEKKITFAHSSEANPQRSIPSYTLLHHGGTQSDL